MHVRAVCNVYKWKCECVCGCEYVIYTHLYTAQITYHTQFYIYVYAHLYICIYIHTPSTRTHNHLVMVWDMYKCMCAWCAMCINGSASACVGVWVLVCNLCGAHIYICHNVLIISEYVMYTLICATGL